MPDEIDRLLNEVLSAYTVAPERFGLKERVLARVSEHTRRRRYWFAFVPATAAAICGLLIVSPLYFTRNELPAPRIDAKPSDVADNYTPPPTTPPKQPIRKRAVEPKRPQFPTPFPLTQQERALLEIAQSHPAQLAALNRPIEPLEIPLIQIEPLDEGKN